MKKVHLFSRVVHGKTVAVFTWSQDRAETMLAAQAAVVCLLARCPGGCCQQFGARAFGSLRGPASTAKADHAAGGR